MRPTAVIALCALAGCTSWFEDWEAEWLAQPLWQPDAVVSAGAEVYAALPRAGDAVRLAPGAEPVLLDLGARRVTQVIASPDGATVLARTTALRCEADPDEVSGDAPCPASDLVEEATLEVLAPTGREASFPIGPWYGQPVFSDDGRYVVVLQDDAPDARAGGVVNLTSVAVLDLVAGTSAEVSVGFRASRVLFMGDAATGTTGMVVLSQSEVVTVDLTGEVPVTGTVFPLTLDPTQVVDPVDVALTADDAHALISIRDASDLYVLDLVHPSINIVSLAGRPSAMAVDPARDQTVLAYGGRSTIEVLDHALFDVTTLEVDAPTDHVFMGDDFALLWSTQGGRDVYRLDLHTLTLDAYRLEWAPYALRVSPDQRFAVALSASQEGGGRLEVLDLRQVDGRVERVPERFGLAGRALDVAFVEGDEDATALLLLEKVDRLYQLAWPSLMVSEVELPSPPVAVGSLSDGTFWITHANGLGLVSFYAPGGEVTSIGGFARFGMYDRPALLDGEEEE